MLNHVDRIHYAGFAICFTFLSYPSVLLAGSAPSNVRAMPAIDEPQNMAATAGIMREPKKEKKVLAPFFERMPLVLQAEALSFCRLADQAKFSHTCQAAAALFHIPRNHSIELGLRLDSDRRMPSLVSVKTLATMWPKLRATLDPKARLTFFMVYSAILHQIPDDITSRIDELRLIPLDSAEHLKCCSSKLKELKRLSKLSIKDSRDLEDVATFLNGISSETAAKITQLTFSFVAFGAQGIVRHNISLAAFSALESLEFAHSPLLKEDGLEALITTMPDAARAKLRTLKIHDVGLTESGLTHKPKLLYPLTGVRVFDARHNKLNGTGNLLVLNSFSETARNNLEQLYVHIGGQQDSFPVECARAFAPALPTLTSLRHLFIGDRGTNCVDSLKIIFETLARAAIKLNELEFMFLWFDVKSADEFATMLNLLPSIRILHFWLTPSHADIETIELLLQKLPRTLRVLKCGHHDKFGPQKLAELEEKYRSLPFEDLTVFIGRNYFRLKNPSHSGRF
jgi:hypothetical protein